MTYKIVNIDGEKMSKSLGNLVTANPWEVAVSPDGRQLYVVFSGTNDMFAGTIVDVRSLMQGEPA